MFSGFSIRALPTLPKHRHISPLEPFSNRPATPTTTAKKTILYICSISSAKTIRAVLVDSIT
jgi:hypothetical protein